MRWSDTQQAQVTVSSWIMAGWTTRQLNLFKAHQPTCEWNMQEKQLKLKETSNHEYRV